MLSREDDDLGSCPVEWFISSVSAARQKNLYNELWTFRCVVTSQGERIVRPLPMRKVRFVSLHRWRATGL